MHWLSNPNSIPTPIPPSGISNAQTATFAAAQSLQGSLSQVQMTQVSLPGVELHNDAQAWGLTTQKMNLLTPVLQLPYRHTAVIVNGGTGVTIRGALSVIGRAFDDDPQTEALFGFDFDDGAVSPKWHQLRSSVLIEMFDHPALSLNDRITDIPRSARRLCPVGTQFAHRISDYFAFTYGIRGSRQWWAHGLEFDTPIPVLPGTRAIVWFTAVLRHEFNDRHPGALRPGRGSGHEAESAKPIFPVIGGHAGTEGSPFLQPDNQSLPDITAASLPWEIGSAAERAQWKTEMEMPTYRVLTRTSDRGIPVWVW